MIYILKYLILFRELHKSTILENFNWRSNAQIDKDVDLGLLAPVNLWVDNVHSNARFPTI